MSTSKNNKLLLSTRGVIRFEIVLLSMITMLFLALSPPSAIASQDKGKAKVLVVMSYDEKNDSEIAVAKGIEEVLTEQELRYFYLDAKNHLEQAADNATKGYALYQSFQPDVVIAADDTAQEAFVLPFLQNKVKTPVVFCGVNDSAEQYGYPNAQVTGIIEKKHYLQSINFARLIDPKIKKMAVVYRDNPPNQINLAQIKREADTYGVTMVDYVAVESSKELTTALTKLRETADALLVLNLGGITDDNGAKMEVNKAMTLAAEIWPKPSIGASKNEIEAGILCGVSKINQEQGQVAARIAIEILQGKTPADIPVTENRNGQRVINAATAKRLGLKLKPMVLIGTELVQ